jgi:hypothetical protein
MNTITKAESWILLIPQEVMKKVDHAGFMPDSHAEGEESKATPKVDHSASTTSSSIPSSFVNTLWSTFAHYHEVPRLRASVRDILRLGKRLEASLDALLATSDGTMSWVELATVLATTVRNLTRARWIPRAVRAGVIRSTSTGVVLRERWREALQARRMRDGELIAQQRDRERFRRESQYHVAVYEAYKLRQPKPRKPPPNQTEQEAMDELARIRARNREMKRHAGAWPGYLARDKDERYRFLPEYADSMMDEATPRIDKSFEAVVA